METPLVDKAYQMEKFPGKGGWTYVVIPEILQNKSNPFGWVTVKGSIDNYELSQYKLMPMGNGQLFLPVKKSIRRIIQKEAGDFVHIILYADESKIVLTEDLIACFENEPAQRLNAFNKLTDGEKKTYIDWINAAIKDETKTNRILEMMDRLEYGLKLKDNFPS